MDDDLRLTKEDMPTAVEEGSLPNLQKIRKAIKKYGMEACSAIGATCPSFSPTHCRVCVELFPEAVWERTFLGKKRQQMVSCPCYLMVDGILDPEIVLERVDTLIELIKEDRAWRQLLSAV